MVVKPLLWASEAAQHGGSMRRQLFMRWQRSSEGSSVGVTTPTALSTRLCRLWVLPPAVETWSLTQEPLENTLHRNRSSKDKNPQENWERRGVLPGEEHASRLSGAKP